MDKITLIQNAIDKAEQRRSKITQESLNVPALASLNIRHLLNNLGAISTRYLEVGVHKSGSFSSATCKNDLISATGIDNFESDLININDKAEPQFLENSRRLLQPTTQFKLIKGDSFDIPLNEVLAPIDFYLFDAAHDRGSQCNALIYYKPVLADEFIYCCDDYSFGDVREGTLMGIEQGSYEVLYYKELLNPSDSKEECFNEFWWRGYLVALLRKK